MKYDFVLFDLDGTLTDPFLGITSSVQHALRYYGIEAKNEELACFIGPPLLQSFMEYYGLSHRQAEKAVEVYRERFSVTGLFENRLYEGIDRMLQQLRAAGSKILLATSKPEVFAVQILEHFAIAKYFDFIGGGTLDGSRVNKDDVVAYVLRESGVSGRGIMVGDRKFDVLGGKALGLETAGVLYGYGSREELETAGADYIAADVAELEKLLLE